MRNFVYSGLSTSTVSTTKEMSNIRCELKYLFYSSDLGSICLTTACCTARYRYPANGSSTIKLRQRYGTFSLTATVYHYIVHSVLAQVKVKKMSFIVPYHFRETRNTCTVYLELLIQLQIVTHSFSEPHACMQL